LLIDKLKQNKKVVIADWKSRCRMLGEKIAIKENDIEKFGMFYDLDDDGFLLLKTKDGIEKIHFGDVTVS
jgi:BirA family biotin operon repressor/biotin-[acetyl-CoA-carboxylase] ligase